MLDRRQGRLHHISNTVLIHSVCLANPVPCCLCKDTMEPGKVDPKTKECLCKCFCDPPYDTVPSVKVSSVWCPTALHLVTFYLRCVLPWHVLFLQCLLFLRDVVPEGSRQDDGITRTKSFRKLIATTNGVNYVLFLTYILTQELFRLLLKTFSHGEMKTLCITFTFTNVLFIGTR